MELYQAEKDRLFKLCHEEHTKIAFLCMNPNFAHSIAEGLFGDIAPTFKMQELIGISVIYDDTVNTFELILNPDNMPLGYFFQRRPI